MLLEYDIENINKNDELTLKIDIYPPSTYATTTTTTTTTATTTPTTITPTMKLESILSLTSPIIFPTIHTYHELPKRSNTNKLKDINPIESEIEYNYPISQSQLQSNIGSLVITLTGIINTPQLWNAETPYLYRVVLTIIKKDSFGNISEIDVEGCSMGIKEVSFNKEYNQLCINRIPITIAGINRHEFCPNNGRNISDELMLLDITLLKQFNFNAVRLSHYPNHHKWLELCDQYGLYVIDECNIETHGFQWSGQAVNYLSSSPQWYGAHLSRFVRMYERDKNFASIIGWSLGNESGVGISHHKMYNWGKLRETNGRFIQYESGCAVSKVTDIICPMYLHPNWCINQSIHDKKKRPVILCEYAHAMGNSSGIIISFYSFIFFFPSFFFFLFNNK